MKSDNLKIGCSYYASIRPDNVIVFGSREKMTYKRLDITSDRIVVKVEHDGTYHFKKCNDMCWEYVRYEPPSIREVIERCIQDRIEVNVLSNESGILLFPNYKDMKPILIKDAAVTNMVVRDNTVEIVIRTPCIEIQIEDFYIVSVRLQVC